MKKITKCYAKIFLLVAQIVFNALSVLTMKMIKIHL